MGSSILLFVPIFAIVMMVGAIWIDANPTTPLVANNGLTTISGYLFWIGVVVLAIGLIIIGFAIYGIYIIQQENRGFRL